MTDAGKVELAVKVIEGILTPLCRMPFDYKEFIGEDAYENLKKFMFATGTWNKADYEDDDELSCPMCGSTNVTISEVYELGDIAWCHTCRCSFRPTEV